MAQKSEQLFLEDFVEGQRFEGEPRQIVDGDFRAFASLTGDRHPIHYDPDYAKKTRFGRRLAHGLHLMALTALGAMSLTDRLEEAMVAFLEQGCRYMKPVLASDVLRSEFVVKQIERRADRDWGTLRFQVRLLNHKVEAVLEGHHLYMIRSRSSARGD